MYSANMDRGVSGKQSRYPIPIVESATYSLDSTYLICSVMIPQFCCGLVTQPRALNVLTLGRFNARRRSLDVAAEMHVR